MTYKQLTSEDRYTISSLRKQGFSAADIAAMLERDRSTIYREVKRNSCADGRYRPYKACNRTRGRRSRSRRNSHFTHNDYKLVNKYLRKKWSPFQISETLYISGLLSISHETIYKYVWRDRFYGGNLYTHLRQAAKKRRKRYNAYDSRGVLAGKRHISERPKVVERRSRLGDWEIDTVVGTGELDCIITLVERKSGLTKIGKLKNRTKQQTNACLIRMLQKLKGKVKTITADNGTEFHGYKDVEKKTGVKFYFATPYHSWERGTNENTNGLIRQYLPKGESMSGLTQVKCNRIAYELNTRPRKRLAFRTPQDVFDKGFVALQN